MKALLCHFVTATTTRDDGKCMTLPEQRIGHWTQVLIGLGPARRSAGTSWQGSDVALPGEQLRLAGAYKFRAWVVATQPRG